jgi:hypothetical protein
MEVDAGRIYPLCVPEVDLGSLPEPLSRLQALSLGKAEHIKQFFQALTDQFGFGDMTRFKGSTIKARLPKYPTLPVAESDLRSGTLYSGPYEGYSDEELAEVIDEQFVGPEWHLVTKYTALYSDDRSNVFRGKLVHYREVDDNLAVPPGTAKRLLNAVVTERYPADVKMQMEHAVRYMLDPDERR